MIIFSSLIHFRLCGRVFCKKCSSKNATIPVLGHTRVCVTCDLVLSGGFARSLPAVVEQPSHSPAAHVSDEDDSDEDEDDEHDA